jgi:hypothetical protein
MRIFRRRPVEATKESALTEARRATASLRRRNAKVARYRAGKQEDPTHEITAGPWMAGGS